MGMVTEDFVTHFHSLTGATIGERRKNLFLLLNRIQQSESAQLDLSLLQPRTPLEEKFKVDALIHFRRVPALLDVLKSENQALVQKIVAIGPWFLEEAFQNVSGEQLVTGLLQRISFNAKVKLVHRLGLCLKDTQQADGFFEAVDRKYGLFLACKLLEACSPELIMRCVKETRFKPTPTQLVNIVKRNPGLTEEILRELKKRKFCVKEEYRKVYVYLANHDLALFLKVWDEYGLCLRLGWRRTVKFLQANKEDVIKNPNRYYRLLHKKQIGKSLWQEFNELYFNMFPATLAQFDYVTFHELLCVVKGLPTARRDVNLLLRNFEKAYGLPLWRHGNHANLEIIDLLPINQRETVMSEEYKNACRETEDKWMCYCKTDKSIPYFKQRISLSSDIKTRADLIGMLVETCQYNADKVALANMCKYMVTRHRNDHISVRLMFLRVIRKRFKLELLEEQHWKPIQELIQIFALNDEQFHHHDEYMEGYIHFRLVHNLPIEEQLTEYLKVRTGSLNIIREQPKYERQCLLAFGELIPTVFKEATLEDRKAAFLSALMDWNKRHLKDPISLFAYPDFLASIKGRLVGDGYAYMPSHILKYCVRLKTEAQERNELLDFYLTKVDNYVESDVLNWLIENEPGAIARNLPNSAQLALKHCDNLFFFKYAQNYTHLEIPQQIIKRSLDTLKKPGDDETEATSKHAVQALSLLMSNSEFKDFIVPYYPTGLKADAKTKESKKLYRMQEFIGASLRNLTPASSALEVILTFCKGDYLKLIQRSLYSLSGNVNEDNLPPFFNELATRAVSIRKHSMHLTLRVLDKQAIFLVIKKFMETEKNASIRKFIFKGVFSFFVKNPDDYSWELVKSNAAAVDATDNEAVDTLMDVDKIPHQFIIRYILFAWDFLNKLPDVGNDSERRRSTLMRAMTPTTIPLLPQEFCTSLIETYFFKCPDGSLTHFQSLIQTFACRYIIYAPTQQEQDQRLRSTFSTVTDYAKTTWHIADLRAGSRNCVSNFVKEFSLEFLSDTCHDKEILVKFVELWNGVFSSHVAFSEYLHLQFVLIWIEKLAVAEIGQRLAQLCDSLSSVYGVAFVDAFYKKINFFAKYLLSGEDAVLEENWYVLIENLIRPQKSIVCSLLVILLITEHTPDTPKTIATYNRLIEMFEKETDPMVQLYLHIHFKGGRTSLDYY